MYLVNPTDAILGPKASELAGIAAVHRAQRNAAVITAVHVARDWVIEEMGNRYGVDAHVKHYMNIWLQRNGAEAPLVDVVIDLVDAVWALAELPDADPLQLVDDTWRGTSDEAHDMLQAQYERDLSNALSRITWKDR